MSRPLRLLLVEDNDVDAQLVMRQVCKAGFEADWHRVECREEYLRHLRPDLDVILCDFSLPAFGAPEALELLHHSGHDIPFIIVSGTIGEDTAVAAMRQGAADYLLKDRLARLGQSIEQALEKSRERRLRAHVEAELRETQERFHLLADTIAEVFWITSADRTQVQYISSGYEKIWGHSRELLYANPSEWLKAVHPEDKERVRATAFGRKSSNYEVEYRIASADGSERWIFDRGFSVLDAQGQITRMVGVATDVSKRRALEDEYRHAQKMEALGQLSAGVAHDFNNLLTVIGGNASFLTLPGADAQQIEECFNEIIAAVESAASLTSQLLMFSRKKAMQRKPTDLNEVTAKSARMLTRMLGADIEIRCQLLADLPLVQADSSMLDQVFMNLAVNARDAMPNGGVLTMSTGVVPADPGEAPWVFVAVTDSGLGIPDETLPRLFEPFFTTKEAGQGTGLGLATVFGILDQHHGRVEVESEVGIGSTFRILLRACATPVAPDFAPVAARKVATQGGEGILVVDDEPSVRALLVRFLRRSGYRVFESESGKAALELWPNHRDQIQLLLTDMVMPDGVTGYDLAQILRQDKPSLKVVLTSGYSEDLATRGRVADESFGFLQKPFDLHKLMVLIRERLD